MIVHMDKDSSMGQSRSIRLGQKRLVNGQLLRSAHHVHRPRFFNIKVRNEFKRNRQKPSIRVGTPTALVVMTMTII